MKRVICKNCAGTLTNSADQYQTPQNMVSDQDLHCLLKLQEVNGYIKQSYAPVQDNFLSVYSEKIDPPVLSVL